MLSNILSRYWWTVLLRGFVWILLGIAIVLMPGISLVSFTLLFGAFALVDGVATVVSAFGGRQEHHSWWAMLLAGLAGIIVGVLAFVNPAAMALGLVLYIGIWAIVTGILEIVTALHLRKEIEGEFWLVLGGLASVLFGVLMIGRPGVGALTVLWLIAGYAIVLGVTLIMLAFKAKAFARRARAAVRSSSQPR